MWCNYTTSSYQSLLTLSIDFLLWCRPEFSSRSSLSHMPTHTAAHTDIPYLHPNFGFSINYLLHFKNYERLIVWKTDSLWRETRAGKYYKYNRHTFVSSCAACASYLTGKHTKERRAFSLPLSPLTAITVSSHQQDFLSGGQHLVQLYKVKKKFTIVYHNLIRAYSYVIASDVFMPYFWRLPLIMKIYFNNIYILFLIL